MGGMNEKQYFQARERERREHESRLRSLDVAWTMIHGTQPPKPPSKSRKEAVPATAGGESGGADRPTVLTQALLEIVADMPAEFNTVEVDKILRATHPELDSTRPTVTRTLKRLADGRLPVIQIVELGKGKRPTKYRKSGLQTATVGQGMLDDEFKDL
jgi:hypothetical protein